MDLRIEGRGDLDSREGNFQIFLDDLIFGDLRVGETHPSIGWKFSWNSTRNTADLKGNFETISDLLKHPKKLDDENDLSGLFVKLDYPAIFHSFQFGSKEVKLPYQLNTIADLRDMHNPYTKLERCLLFYKGMSPEIIEHFKRLILVPNDDLKEFSFYFHEGLARTFDQGKSRFKDAFRFEYEGRTHHNEDSGRIRWSSSISAIKDALPNQEFIEWIVKNHEDKAFSDCDAAELAEGIVETIRSTLDPSPITHLVIRDRKNDPKSSLYLSSWAREYDSCVSYVDAKDAYNRRLASGQACAIAEILAQKEEENNPGWKLLGFQKNFPATDNSINSEFLLIQDISGYFSGIGNLSKTMIWDYPDQKSLMKAYRRVGVPDGWHLQDHLYAVRLLPVQLELRGNGQKEYKGNAPEQKLIGNPG